tara:strand:- start:7200 stop:7655 length:456 start_codon:yes stop_codon:yes gene_type:complete
MKYLLTPLVVLVSLLISTASPAVAGPVSKPNFIIIFCDDMGYADIGPFGAEGYQTPNLNAVRKGKWKLIFPSSYTVWEKGSDGIPGAKRTQHPMPLSLYNLDTDVGETTNVADQHPLIVDEIQALADAARADLGDGKTEGANVRLLGGISR